MSRYWFIHSLLSGFLLLPTAALAADATPGNILTYIPLVGVPGVNATNPRIGEYINALYILSITAGGFIAVANLMIAGIQYALTDVVPNKGAAIERMKGSALGLLILVTAVLILETINPALKNFAVLEDIPFNTIRTNNQLPSVDIVITNTRDGIEREKVADMTPEQLVAYGKNCEEKTGEKARRTVHGEIYCPGIESRASEDNIINEVNSFVSILDERGFADEEKNALRKQYNDYVGSQEPEGLNEDLIEAIRQVEDAERVLFVVNKVTGSDPRTVGLVDQQRGLCEKLTGSDNFVIGDTYGACLE